MKPLSAADLRALSIFQTICRCGGFAAAEDALELSQSTISNHISGLENRLGYSLCTRGRKGFQLTERGKIVLSLYEKMAVNLDSFSNEVHSLLDESSGVLRVGILDHILTEPSFSVVRLIDQFIQKAPNVELHLIQDTQFNLHTSLVEEQLDIVIGVAVSNSNFVKFTRLYNELHNIYCGSSHPLFNKPTDSIIERDLETANWVTNGYPPGVFSMQPFPWVKSSVIANNIESIAMAIMAGHHIGYLPEHFAAPYEDRGQLRRLLSKDKSNEVDISIITKVNRRQTSAMRKFHRICCEQANQL